MKRLIAILLSCLMLLPFCLPLCAGAESKNAATNGLDSTADETTDNWVNASLVDQKGKATTTDHMKMDQTVFRIGEAINVTPTLNSGDNVNSWIGIVPEKEEKPFISGGSIFYHNIKDAGSGVTVDMLKGTPISATDKNANVAYARSFKDCLTNTTSGAGGNYYIVFVPSGSGLKDYTINPAETNKSLLTEYIKIHIVPETNEPTIKDVMKLEKTTFTEGEPIMVTAWANNTNDWVGIVSRSDSNAITGASIRWRYINTADGKGDSKGQGNGVAIDLRKAYVQPGSEAKQDLPAGNYWVVFVESNGGVQKAKYKIPITVLHLSANKTEYNYGEPIYVASKYETAKDWISIIKAENTSRSILWEYAKDLGSYYNIRLATHKSNEAEEKDYLNLPAGKYKLVYCKDPNGNKSWKNATEYIEITIKDTPETLPGKPLNATYQLTNNTDGFAGGSVTVTVSDLSLPGAASGLMMYWGDANGRLAGYTALAKQKVVSETTKITMPPYTLIPTGATKLLIYTFNAFGVSKECFTVDLPAGSAAPELGKAILEFQVGSDLHLVGSGSATDILRRQHTTDFLLDIVENSPDSKGIIINGDLTDYGALKQYQMFIDIIDELVAAGYTIPDIHYAIGNHEFFDGNSTSHYDEDFAARLRLYLQGSKAIDDRTAYDENNQYEHAYRDFFIDGYHFILLSSDAYPDGTKAATKAKLNEEQLNWLRDVLAANKNASKPTFVFLHQPMKNTVSGSLAAQGWEGVEANSTAALQEIFKDYPEIMFFNGHTHWDMNDENNLYYRDGTLPTILNTAAVGYLWSSYNIVTGENLKGSQSYYIYVYADQVIVRGWDNETHEWIPSAYYSISYSGLEESGDTETAGVKAEGISLTPGDRIGINSYFTFSDDVLADNTAAMRFTMPDGSTVDVPLANATRKMLQGKVTLMFTVDVAPAQMADTVTFQLTRSGNGVGKTYTYSVLQYAEYILANRANYADAAPVVEAMLYYGMLTKSYFNYKGVGNITLNEQTLAALNSAAAATTPDSAFRSAKSGTLPAGLTYAGSTLLLDSATVVRHYFSLADGAKISDYTFVSGGKTLTPEQKNGMWYVDLPAKTVAEFGTAQTLSVGGFTLSYSPMSYIYAVLSAPDKYDPALLAVVRGFAVYYQAAVTYFHL